MSPAKPAVANSGRGVVRRVTRGVLASLFGQGIQAASQVVLVPVFLAAWGTQRYGEWLVLSAALTQLTVIDFGIQMYAVNRLTQSYARHDLESYRQTLHSALALSTVVSAGAAICAAVALPLLPLASWFHFRVTSQGTAVAVGMLMILQVLGSIPYGLLAGTYRSITEFARGQMIENAKAAVMFAAAAGLLVAGGGLISIAAAQVTVVAGVFGWVWRDLRSRHPEIALGMLDASKAVALSLVGPGALFFLIQLSFTISAQGATIAVGTMFGAASVASFVALRTMANLFRQGAGVLHSALWPELTRMEATADLARLRQVFLLVSKLLVVFAGAAAIFLHFVAGDMVALWTHHRLEYRLDLMDALLGMLIIHVLWSTSALVLAASNHHRIVAICNLLSTVCGFGLGFLASSRFGLPGFVHGLWLADLSITGWAVPSEACRLIGLPFRRFFVEVALSGILLCVPLYAAVAGTFHLLAPGSAIARIAAAGLAVGLVGPILVHHLYLRGAERKRLWRLVRSVIEPI